ncbi:MAG: hypothetical protein ABSG43_07165 [Solirubrobacteraceae bacterium]
MSVVTTAASIRVTVDADRRAAGSLITTTFSAGRRAHAARRRG